MINLKSLILITILSFILCSKCSLQQVPNIFNQSLPINNNNSTVSGITTALPVGTCVTTSYRTIDGKPFYYSCPRPGDKLSKQYCCNPDKCCDFKDFQKQQLLQNLNFGKLGLDSSIVGKALKWVLVAILIVVALIVGCCILVAMSCKKSNILSSGMLSTFSQNQNQGQAYVPGAQPYPSNQWAQPNTNNQWNQPAAPPQAQPSYPGYPPYPTGQQQPFNPNYH